MTSIQCY